MEPTGFRADPIHEKCNKRNVVRPLPHCNRYASHMPCVLMTSIHVQGREQSITASSNSNHGASERVNTHLNQLR